MSERGQLFTIEALIAAIVLLATLVFALHAVGISANSASAGETELRSQHTGLAAGILEEAAENGTLERTLLYWNVTANRFHSADNESGHYVARSPPNETLLGESLGSVFDERQVRYNINLYYRTENGSRAHQQLVEFGTPSDDAVRVVETVTLSDNDHLVTANGTAANETLADVADAEFYAPDVGGPLYNVVRVEVVLWQS